MCFPGPLYGGSYTTGFLRGALRQRCAYHTSYNIPIQCASSSPRPQCPDIKNYDKGSYYNRDVFGDIDDPYSECGSAGASCIYYEGEIIIGRGDPIVGETSDICEL